MMDTFNSVDRSETIEKLVMKGNARKYYCFRPAINGGGSATADVDGCNLLCAYCWNVGRISNPGNCNSGEFLNPEEVADQLLKISKRKGYHRYRFSGAEPILGEKTLEHTLEVIEEVKKLDSEANFVLETNGIMLGHSVDLCRRLSLHSNSLLVKIGIKGKDSDSFQKITGANGEGFLLPLLAIQHLESFGVHAHTCVMSDLYENKELEDLGTYLKNWKINTTIEHERLDRSPAVLKNLQKREIIIKREKRLPSAVANASELAHRARANLGFDPVRSVGLVTVSAH